MNFNWLGKNILLLGVAFVFLHLSLTTISEMTGREPIQDIGLLAIGSILVAPSFVIIFHFLEIKNYKPLVNLQELEKK